jgi:hypothetical protein
MSEKRFLSVAFRCFPRVVPMVSIYDTRHLYEGIGDISKTLGEHP